MTARDALRQRTSRELGLAGNHPDAIASHLDAYEAEVTAAAYRAAADEIEAGDPDGWAHLDRPPLRAAATRLRARADQMEQQ